MSQPNTQSQKPPPFSSKLANFSKLTNLPAQHAVDVRQAQHHLAHTALLVLADLGVYVAVHVLHPPTNGLWINLCITLGCERDIA